MSLLYLRVNRKYLCRFPTATEDDPNPLPTPPLSGTTEVLNVIIANVDDLDPFSDGKTNWLIRVARLIFEPLGTSSLYTFTAQTVDYWMDREMDVGWRQVMPGEPLMATIYEFRPNNNVLIALTQMSPPPQEFFDSTPRAIQFQTDCFRRDRRCVISEEPQTGILQASHLIQKQLGDVGVQSAFQRFSETGSTPLVDRYDSCLGVTLLLTLDSYLGVYELGFWKDESGQYVIHTFVQGRTLNVCGLTCKPNQQIPLCHGARVTLSNNGSSIDPPPVGVFNWHYVQCVLKRFSTADYQTFENVAYFVYPICTNNDDSDSDFDDPSPVTD